MMSVVIAACGMRSRTRSRMPRNRSLRYDRRIALRMRSLPDCSGMCSCGMTDGRLGHRVDDVVGERGGVGAREADALETVDLAGGAKELAEGLAIAELDAVGVDVLPEQRDLDGAVVDEQADLVQDVAGATILLLAAEARHDAEGAGVVAADRDRHPAAVDRVALGGQRAREDLERFEDLELGLAVVSRALQQARKRPHVVGAEDDVDPRCLVEDRVLVHLGEAAADGDLHALVLVLAGLQVAERAVELPGRVVADRARVDDDDIGFLAEFGPHIAGAFERSRQALGVVDVHLTAERAHLVGAGTAVRGVRGGRGRDERRRRRRVGHDGCHSTSRPWVRARRTGSADAAADAAGGQQRCRPP